MGDSAAHHFIFTLFKQDLELVGDGQTMLLHIRWVLLYHATYSGLMQNRNLKTKIMRDTSKSYKYWRKIKGSCSGAIPDLLHWRNTIISVFHAEDVLCFL